mgnify:CR=1 FL=1
MEAENKAASIRTENLVKEYGKRRVVKGVNISLDAGEVVGLLGPNGAGKTTSFYMIVGLVPATSGKVFLDDVDITDVPMYKRARMGIGYLPQEASIFRKLTVYENILAVAETLPIPRKELKKYCVKMLEDLGLNHLSDQKAFTLSGGERQRIALARIFYENHDILIMDEPTAAMDIRFEKEFYDLVFSYLKDKTILMISHRLASITACDRIFYMENGSITEQGTHQELMEKQGKYAKLFLAQLN